MLDEILAAEGVHHWFGLYSLIFGIWMVVRGIELRRTGQTLDSAVPEKQPA